MLKAEVWPVRIATAEEMQAIDAAAIGEYGIPGLVLMENAGLRVVEAVGEWLIPGARTVVLCGRGSNGGDGLVVVRHLHTRGAEVQAVLLAPGGELTGDAATNLGIARRLGVPLLETPSPRALRAAVTRADLLIDAILGTGATGPARGWALAGIRAAGSCPGRIVAVDIPSGVSADTGAVPGPAITAHLTVTFGLPKIGLYTYPGRAHCGEVRVADIGLPPQLLASPVLRTNLLTGDEAARHLPPRAPNGHKGDFGRLVILGGSPGMTGAPALAAEGALRAGAGLVTVGCAASLNPILEVKLTEAMTRPLPESPGAALAGEAVGPALDLCAAADAVVLGPGLGRLPGSTAFAREVAAGVAKPLVVDADGLNALVGTLRVLGARPAPTILTPHPGEMARLCGAGVGDIQADRLGWARRLAKESGAVVVLKGAGTVVATPEGEAWINTSGSSALATGGTGDVLSGAIGAFLAGGSAAASAAVAGVYYHGAAGDLAESRGSGRGVVAGDVARALAEVLP